MIKLQLNKTSVSKSSFFKEVIEYFAAWGIPADKTGRTDNGKMHCTNTNPSYKGNIPDDKVLAYMVTGHEILLNKMAKEGVSGFDLHIGHKHFWGKFQFIKGRKIVITEVTNASEKEVVEALDTIPPRKKI